MSRNGGGPMGLAVEEAEAVVLAAPFATPSSPGLADRTRRAFLHELEPEHFLEEHRRQLFRAIRTVFASGAPVADRKAVDVQLTRDLGELPWQAGRLVDDLVRQAGPAVESLEHFVHVLQGQAEEVAKREREERLRRACMEAAHLLGDASLTHKDPGQLARLARERLDDVAREAAEGAEPVFATLSDLQARPELLQPPECVVPRIAYRGRLAILAAPDKAGKSTLLAHAVAALTRRHRFLGEPMGARERRAVWMGLEEAVGDAVRRFHDLQADGDRVQLVVLPVRDLLDRTRTALRQCPADLLVIDSLSEYARVTLGTAPEDGDSSGWGAVVRPLVALAREHDVAVVVLHHVRRSDGEYRGAGEIAAAADVLLELEKPKNGEDPAVRRIRGRGRWTIDPFAVALRDSGYELAGGTPLSPDALILLRVEQNPGCSMNDAIKDVPGRRSTNQDRVRELIARGAIENLGGEGEWALHRATEQHSLEVS